MLNEKKQFNAMGGPPEHHEAGSYEWIERMSYRLQNDIDKADRYGIKGVMTTLQDLLPCKPWLTYPEPPYGNPEEYFVAITGHSWDALSILIVEYGSDEDRDLLVDMGKAIKQAMPMLNPEETNQHSVDYNIISNIQGTDATYTLRRLKRDHPKLADRVIDGELSANAAAIEAGFRKRKIQIEPTVAGFVNGMLKHLSDADINKVVEQVCE